MENTKSLISFLLIMILAIIVIVFIKRKFKILSLPNVFLVSGRVKGGKTLLSLHLAKKQYRKQLVRYFVKVVFCTLLFKPLPEKPMLYSNIPLAKTKFNYFTKDILLRKVRIPHGSVVFLDEVSLVADSKLYNDENINIALMQFIKLYAHMSHNGFLFMNTQSMGDCHYAFKRCIGSYLWIKDRHKYPFFTVLRVREMMYSDDRTIVNSVNEDADLSLRRIIIFNGTYKCYNSTAYSSLTDKLPVQVDYDVEKLSPKDDLRVFHAVSLQKFMEVANEYLKKEYPDKYLVCGCIGKSNEKEKDN